MDHKEYLEKEPEDYALEDIFCEDFWQGLNLDDPAETQEPEAVPEKEETPEEPVVEESVEALIEEFRDMPVDAVSLEDLPEDFLEMLGDSPAEVLAATQEEIPDEAQTDQQEDSPLEESAENVSSVDNTSPEENAFPAEEESDPELDAILEAAKDEPLVKIKKKRQKPTWQKNVLLYLHDLIYLMAAVIVIFLLLFRVVVVSGKSMNNTLYDGDYLLLINNIFYQNPKQGDVIVAAKDSFRDGAPIVKRIIATEGQKVDIDFDNGIVYVDGKALDEPYVCGSTTLSEGMQFPLTVEDGKLFVMGDNRGESMDSRDPRIGLIDKREVMGKVVFLFFPGTNYNQHPREFDRIGAVD